MRLENTLKRNRDSQNFSVKLEDDLKQILSNFKRIESNHNINDYIDNLKVLYKMIGSSSLFKSGNNVQEIR